MRFVADRMLGKLARLLRMLGQDVEWQREGDRDEVLVAARGRVLLTRDRQLAHAADEALFIENAYPYHQARQVLRAFGIGDERAFTRCVEDNGLLEPAREVEPEEVPPAVRAENRALYRCRACRKLYWPGSHVDRMRATILELVDAPRPRDDHAPELDDAPPLGRLEPLLDVHQAMDALFWAHRVALLSGKLPAALRELRRFAASLARHLDVEEEVVLPTYAAAEPLAGFPRGGAPDIFRRDHAKMIEGLKDLDRRMEAIIALEDEEARDLARLDLLDAERKYLDLLAHHDHRERLYLYPRLAEILSVAEQEALVQRFDGLAISPASHGADSFDG